MRPGAKVREPGHALRLIAPHPFGGGLWTDAEGNRRRVPGNSLLQNHPGQRLSTTRRQSGILMNVHSIFLLGNRLLVAFWHEWGDKLSPLFAGSLLLSPLFAGSALKHS